MKIEADREVCVGAGMCALTAADLFDQDDEDGRVIVLNATPDADDTDLAREAVMLCPSGALTLIEEPAHS